MVKIFEMDKKDRSKYLKMEHKAYENLIRKGYLPQGVNKSMTKVVVFKIEHEHTNREHTEVFYFEDWIEADRTLK